MVEASTDYAFGAVVSSVAAGDLDGNGSVDLAVTSPTFHSVTVLLNSGVGTFDTKVAYSTGLGPSSVVAVDLDGDEMLDLAVANYGGYSVSVLTNLGNGTFVEGTTYYAGTHPRQVGAGDFTGDGKIDLFFTAVNLGNDRGQAAILPNVGSGSFGALIPIRVGNSPQSFAVGDVDGDSKPDVVVPNYGQLHVLLNRDGVLSRVEHSAGERAHGVTAVDLDANGQPDFVVANSGGQTITVALNKGNGNFTTVNYPAGTAPHGVAAATSMGTATWTWSSPTRTRSPIGPAGRTSCACS